MMTSLDMHGFPITLYRPTDEDRRLLAAPAAPASWLGHTAFGETAALPLPGGFEPIRPTPSDHLPLADHTQLRCAIGQELSQTMGGSSGVLLAIFFAAAGDTAAGGPSRRRAARRPPRPRRRGGGAPVRGVERLTDRRRAVRRRRASPREAR